MVAGLSLLHSALVLWKRRMCRLMDQVNDLRFSCDLKKAIKTCGYNGRPGTKVRPSSLVITY